MKPFPPSIHFHNLSCPVVVVDVLRVYRLPHTFKGHRSDDEINICRHICVCLNVLLIFSSCYDELCIGCSMENNKLGKKVIVMSFGLKLLC